MLGQEYTRLIKWCTMNKYATGEVYCNLAQRVDLDAMIPREDFGVIDDTFQLDLMSDFPLRHLTKDAPVLRLLRKPDFQRETNHWKPDQVVSLIESFVDGEVIPSLILWKAPAYIFVIDGGHRLSALRAWMEDDYGDKHISKAFYRTEIPKKQLATAKRTRDLVEKRIGRYSDFLMHVDIKEANGVLRKRSQVVATRALPLQWIQGSAAAAETSFHKINSQGTPLDEVETLLIKHRRGPIAISARAIVRAGSGHKYWSGFLPDKALEIETITANIYDDVFKPELDEPVKTLELPVGGSVSPVDALGLLIEFLSITGTRSQARKSIDKYPEDSTGDLTIEVLKNAYSTLERISGKSNGSLGLHPAVYFYNERGKYSRYLFLGVVSVIQDKIRNNNTQWFKRFTAVRASVERFLVENKALIGMAIVNLNKSTRVDKIRDLLELLVSTFSSGEELSVESAVSALGLSGRILDVRVISTSPKISDATKSAVYLKTAIPNAMICSICNGVLDPNKSANYDHIQPRRDGGTGDADNVQMTHPYCNTGYKS